MGWVDVCREGACEWEGADTYGDSRGPVWPGERAVELVVTA